MNILEIMRLLSKTNCVTKGVFLELNGIVATRHWSEIKDGKVEINGREPSENVLAEHFGLSKQELVKCLKSLNNAGLLGFNPLRLTKFAEYNKHYIAVVEANVKRHMEPHMDSDMDVHIPITTNTNISSSCLFNEDFVNNVSKQAPEMVYWYCFGHKTSGAKMTEIAKLVNKYGKVRTNEAMVTIGKGGWAFGNVEKVLRGEWDRPKGKTGKDLNTYDYFNPPEGHCTPSDVLKDGAK